MRIGVLPLLSLPRHPLLRVLVVVAWVLVLALLLATGLIAGALVAGVAALVLLLRRWLGPRQRPVGDPDFIEGEFTVMPKGPRMPLPPVR